ncbi:GNAT family N-acetyltransferase [Joostella sp. CR20]|uniref:GNAT family N-acetyltransferase n=1 Tax=Joostella sp. CR20 TaxID=2804312 RepID=UPI00313B4C92
MKFQFKKIEKENLPQVLQLFKETAEKIGKMNVDHWQYWKNPPEEKITWVADGIQNGEFFFVTEQSGETIGMVRILTEDLLYWGVQQEKATYVHSLVVKEKYNGKGVGTEILHEIAKNAKSAGSVYLRLDADAKNPKLCSYYEKMGFEKVGVKQLSLSNYNLYQKEV